MQSRILLLVCLFCALGALLTPLSAKTAQNLERDIARNKDKLANAKSQELAISKKLDELGKAINSKNIELNNLAKTIKSLEQDIAKNQDKNIVQEKTLKDIKERQEKLLAQKNAVELQIVKLLAQHVAFGIVVQNEARIDSAEGVVEFHIYELLQKHIQKSIKALNARHSIINNDIKSLTNNISTLQNTLKSQISKRDRLREAKEQQNAILANMQLELKSYNQQLKDIVKERESLDSILSELSIIKGQKAQKGEQQAFIDNQKKPTSIKAPKQFGTSYRNVPTISYKGAKTIAPLEKFSIEKQFGPYFDPVYKFKIFNAAIMFNPKSPNASVRNVLDGKVVYAKEASGLKKVVIIEHQNAIHTIYAYLDKIEASIKRGANIKKGTIIGKVNERLSFEITQKDKHINPAEFVKLN